MGKLFKEIVNDALRAGLTAKEVLPKPRAYTLGPHQLGKVRDNINRDKALALSDLLEDEELVRKLRLKK